ncbi:MAG: hypothetical protein LBK72_01735, partial [Bifidobacteriaceae bacterium]|nr:hypothetical protein [Bifidobacteriaceae bacterium]
MTTPSERAVALRQQIESSDIPVTWRTPDDLARRSVEAMAGMPGDEWLVSHGTLHLTGEGVVGASAPMEHVAQVMSAFQRLVTAWGAALEGVKSLRGAFSVGIQQRTRLRLVAGIAPGSVVLNLTPDLSPARELTLEGMEAMIGQPVGQRLDQVLEQVSTLVREAAEVGPDAGDTALVSTLSGLGPRAASCLRSFSEQLASGGFDLDLEWAQPHRPTFRGSITASKAGHLARVITGRDLDRGEVTITGVLHTVSDAGVPWEVEAAGQRFRVRRGHVTGEMVRATRLGVGDTVRITAQVSLKDGPGGEKAEYRAMAVEVVGEDTPHG